MISRVLTADLIKDQENTMVLTILHLPAKDCLMEILYRIWCTLNLLADWLGKFLLLNCDWEGDAFHIDEKCCLFHCVSMAAASGFSYISDVTVRQKETFTYPDLLDLTEVISVRLLFARLAEYMLSFAVLLGLNQRCLISDTLGLL